MQTLEKLFHLKENKTTVKTEMMAGLTTFMTMAYILVVNPSILSASGMDAGALLNATCISSAIGCFCMGFLANYPFALAPGMRLNAYFTYTVVMQYGYSWQNALAAVFVEGIIFILLTCGNVREAIFNAIPHNLKKAVSVGIGMFIAFIGMTNAGVIVSDPSTFVALGDVASPSVFLALIATIITVALVIRNVKGALLFGIFITQVLGILCQLAGIYVVDPANGVYSLIPSSIIATPPDITPIFGKLSFSGISIGDFRVIVFSFLFVDLLDALGTLIGVATKTNMLDENNKLPRIRNTLFADAIATTAGTILGTSTVTTFVESASGVTDGGRTGLTAIATGCFFLLALFFSPIITMIPSFATTPALVVVGLFMAENVTQINFSDDTEGFPAFICILMMVIAYSISEG